jgi:nitrite reductase/ring-hydroxylating ferredoxin subunit
LVKVGNLSELPPDSVMEANVEGECYAVCNLGGEIHALSGTCLHVGGPLGQGNIVDGRLVCPWHMWEYDCRTGEYDRSSVQRLETFELKVEGGDIFLQIP